MSWLGDLAARGVSVRTLVPEPGSSGGDPLHCALPAGCAMRCADPLPPVLLIADGETAIIPAVSPRAQALVVTDPALAGVMATVFDQSWLRAAPCPESAVSLACPIEPPEIDVALLRLLSARHTDETAARRLGVSLRTVRRRMAAIMTQLDADSRFQAGINAARRGWL